MAETIEQVMRILLLGYLSTHLPYTIVHASIILLKCYNEELVQSGASPLASRALRYKHSYSPEPNQILRNDRNVMPDNDLVLYIR